MENICCDPSLELSQWDGSNKGLNIYFKGGIGKIIPKLSLLPLVIWSTASCIALDQLTCILCLQEVKDLYGGIVKMLDSGDKIKVDQTHLETVIPAIGEYTTVDGLLVIF